VTRRAERAEAKLARAQQVIEIQGKVSVLLAGCWPRAPRTTSSRDRDDAYLALEPLFGTKGACSALGRSRATHYRHRKGPRLGPPAPRPSPPNALSQPERDEVLSALHGRCVDAVPAQAWAILLDEGTYLASESTMYRLLRTNGEVRDLFVMLDIFSRYCCGWMVVDQEDGQVAKAWIAEVTESQHIAPHRLTIHADRGSSMTSKPVDALLSDLKIGRTLSRPHV
jgi:putative transposase